MKLVVGLGNPGPKYDGTRHNVGFAAVDLLAARHGVAWEAAPRGVEALVGRWRAEDVVLAKPLTFMNLSGTAIVGLLQFYKIDVADMIVVVDEVQLETGRIRVRPEGSSGGHNGLKSIVASLGTMAFPRLRIGVGRGDSRRDLADHVLARFDPAERDVVQDSVARAADAVETFVADGVQAAMARYNRKTEEGRSEDGTPAEDQRKTREEHGNDGKRNDDRNEDN
jgi:PTH1 family peptidyl-tRNA hydrolase